jgi:predicted dinucleotide-binding enzyme
VLRPTATVAIIGAGNVGGTLGKAWAKKGHEIFFGVRHPQDDKTRQVVQSIGPKAQAGTVAEAAAFGEVVVLATPWQGTEAAVRAAGNPARLLLRLIHRGCC